ncbi:D-alanine--D-alanine ligase [Actibacterium pelagium]|uniref:D-alanine--D-alanine ligase n=2 Tax=Actibacterium pelagium TaxID=2029103 RepID=A0A917EHM9_9RHOB|nr:D-alanine--D-alanine ligase [Actibacterium pelagium]
MDAADVRKINVIPVYMNFEGRFFHGPLLRQLGKFRPKPGGLSEVQFAWGEMGPCLRHVGSDKTTLIDCALPVFHGPFGEDGRIQGMLEVIGIPTTGFSAVNSALAMRKDATKSLVKSVGVNVLPHAVVNTEELRHADAVCDRIEAEFAYPLIVKPANLGSSVGVGLAKDRATLLVSLQNALREDSFALVEPQVQNMEELNIAVMFRDGEICFSAIERPKSSAELLDFKEKYLSSGDSNQVDSGSKLGAGTAISQGMLSLTRDINPDISDELKNRVYDYAAKAFTVLGLRGAPRMDFMRNTETGEVWFNEINPIPGSYGFFLWEAASPTTLFPHLVEHLVQEALADSRKEFGDPVPQAAQLLPR